MKKTITLSIFIFSLASLFAQSGITWDMGMNISTNTYGNMHPRMAVDGAGNPMVIWGRMSDESVHFSKWNGTAFTTPVQLNPAGMTVATASWQGPDIAAKGDTVYVVVKRTPEAPDTNHVYLLRSFDGGANFLAPVQVEFIADSISRFPTVTIDELGNPIVAFMKFNATFGDSRWVVARSNDFGSTFETDVKASGWGSSAEVCDCCPGALVSSGNTTAMLYRDNNSNIRDMWAGISTDNAANFNSGFTVDNHNWMLMSCPSSGPDGVMIGDSLYTVFMSGAGGSRTFLSTSSVSGGAVNTVANLTGAIPGLSLQNFPRIASFGSAMAIVWKQVASGSTHLPLLFTNDIANGLPATFDTVDLDNITNADVAVTNGKVFVVWEDGGSGTVKFRSGTFTPVISTAVAPRSFEEVGVRTFPNPATDMLRITLPVTEKTSVRIFNSLGEEVYATSAGANCEVPVVNWSSGVYFIQAKTAQQFIAQKFTKQ